MVKPHIIRRAVEWLKTARLQTVTVVLCATLVLGYGTSAVLSLWLDWDQTLEDASGSLEAVSRSAEIGTTRAIIEIEGLLLGSQSSLSETLADYPLDDPAVRRVLRRFNDLMLLVRDLLVFDEQGRLVNRARSDDEGLRRYADQKQFEAHFSPAPPGTYVGVPQPSNARGGWSVMVSRPLLRLGSAIGVLAAEVPLATFGEVLRSQIVQGSTEVTLLRDDGVVIASSSPRDELVGQQPAYGDAVLKAAARQESGVLADRRMGGGRQLRAFRRLQGRPLLIVTSRPFAEVLAPWGSNAQAAAIGFLIFAMAASGLTWLLLKLLDRQQRMLAELRGREQQLSDQRTLLQNTLENMGEGISVFDRDGRLIAWNSRFVEQYGLDLDAGGEHWLRDILQKQVLRGDFGPIADPDKEVAERCERFYRDLPAVIERTMPNGRILQVRRRAMPDGAVVSLYSDITERKVAEQKMAQAWHEAQLANRSKSEFLANMSHELRTPLNAIIGFSEVICGEILGPMQDKRYLDYINDIHSSGLHLLAIIDDVLDMSKIEAGKMELTSEIVALQQVVNESLRMVSERAGRRSLDLVTDISPTDLRIWADERAIKQVLLNLLSNAVKFSHEGGEIAIRVGLDPSGGLQLEVEDHGIGMTPEEVERAMQPFGQAKSVTTRAVGGTGLGVPISKGLVEAHGGRLTIRSAAGQGTVVRMTLPRERTILPEKADPQLSQAEAA